MSSKNINKKNVSLISISVIVLLSLTLSVDARVAVSDSSDKILLHEATESPHIGTVKTLEYFEKYLTDHIIVDRDSRKSLENKIDNLDLKLDGLVIIICSNSNNDC